MTHTEQHGIIMELQDYERSMARSEREEFEMFVKRDKDDEDLDDISRMRVIALYHKHVPERKRNY
jgi:hypothetical protein